LRFQAIPTFHFLPFGPFSGQFAQGRLRRPRKPFQDEPVGLLIEPGAHFGRTADRGDAPLDQHHDPVGQALDLIKFVRRK